MRYLIEILAAASAASARRETANSEKKASDQKVSDKIVADKKATRQTVHWPTDSQAASVLAPVGRTPDSQPGPAATTRIDSRPDASAPILKAALPGF